MATSAVEDDSGKKRESPRDADGQKEEPVSLPQDNAKKLRGVDAPKMVAAATSSLTAGVQQRSKQASGRSPKNHDSVPIDSLVHDGTTRENCAAMNGEPRVLDLETALHRLTCGGGGGGKDGDADDEREYLTTDETSYVTFRMGEACDAMEIATLFRKATRDEGELALPRGQQQQRTLFPSASFELRLAEGLGDEESPPFLFSLLGDVHTGDTTVKLAAVALLTVAWENEERVLRVEWSHVNTSITDTQTLTKRLWLRLSALSVMTSSRLMVAQDSSFPSLF